jgi:hypothetical protein
MINFITGAQSIFSENVVYLIKIVRIMMEAKKPSHIDKENSKSSNIDIYMESKKRIDVFEVL